MEGVSGAGVLRDQRPGGAAVRGAQYAESVVRVDGKIRFTCADQDDVVVGWRYGDRVRRE